VSTLALDIFRRLVEQVDEIEAVASAATADVAPILRRSAFVLGVASIDTYFHERATGLLFASARSSPIDASRVASYLARVTAAEVSGPSGEGYIRVALSYKTLVHPDAIGAVIAAWGGDPAASWRDTAFALGTRPDRLQLQLRVIYDRRNQIAHEGDWDTVQLDFRIMHQAHLNDCVVFVTDLAEKMDLVL
jgi:hypothetical protein